MDIRRYFGGSSKTTTSTKSSSSANAKASSADKKQRKRKADNKDVTEDSDFKPSATRKKRIAVIISSDEDEDPIPRQVKGTSRQKSAANTPVRQSVAANKKTGSSQQKRTSKSPSKAESSLKPITLVDFFGKSPVKRSSRTGGTTVVECVGTKTNGYSTSICEDPDVEIHDDEEFMKTLEQLDSQPAKDVATNSRTYSTPTKKATPTKKQQSIAKDVVEDSLDSVMEIDEEPSQPNSITEELSKLSTPRSSKRKKVGVKIVESIECVEIESGSDLSQPLDTKPKLSTPRSSEKSTRTRKVAAEGSVSSESSGHIQKTPTQNNLKKELSTPTSSDKVKGNAASYLQYLNRSGPKALGSKEIPEGADDCFNNLTFVITGILESLTREDAADIVKKYGGKVSQSVSKKTSFIVVGDEAGPSKLEKAEKFGIKQLDEDGFLNLIATCPGKLLSNATRSLQTCSQIPTGKKIPNLKKEESASSATKNSFYAKKGAEPAHASKEPTRKTSAYFASNIHPCSSKSTSGDSLSDSLLWVDKYKPASLKQIIGQQGDRSNVKKLLWWLQNWQKNNSGGQVKKKPNPMRWNANDDGSAFKAALLSGPPGVGKTTSATLVCRELGFSFVELNASDTRSKKSLKQEVQELLSSHSLSTQFSAGDSSSSRTLNHCLIMDEVDGMAGNEDRGGVQELIALIKSSKVPIICMCNDRNHQKIRSLSNHCFDLRFQRPRIEQLKAAMMSICYKENLTIQPQALQEIIVGTNQDVRQVIHHMSMLSVQTDKLSVEDAHKEAQKSKKDIKIGPFDALKSVFSAEDHKTMSIHDKSDLFFYDYSIAPLFVQENYINVRPRAAPNDKKKQMRLLSRTADSICDGDLVEKMIRSNGHWNLLPLEAMYASVIPGSVMEGTLTCQIAFPSWLGKNSKRGKIDRLLQELALHMRLRISANKTDVNMEYAQRLYESIVHPLEHFELDGVGPAVKILESYDLLRDDVNSLMEVTLWPGQEDPMSKVNSKVKAAFTRAYNSDGHLIPYATATVPKKGRQQQAVGDMEGELGEIDNEEDENEQEDSIANDGMVKVKAPPRSRAAKKDDKNVKPSTSRGRGRGRTR